MLAMWCTAAVYLLASLGFVNIWVQGKKPHAACYVAAAVFAAGAALIPGISQSARFLIALTLGATGWYIACLILCRERLVQMLCVLAAFLAPWFPLLCCPEVVWEYCAAAALILLCGLMTLTDKLLHGELRSAAEQFSSHRYDWALNLLPLMGPVTSCVLVAFRQTMEFYEAIGCCIVVLCVCVLSLFLQDQIRQRIKLQVLNRAFRQWQQESRDYMNTIRSQRHDFNLHLHAISGLISGGEYEECGKYVRKLVEDAAAVNDIMPVADAVVGSMLYNMREQARRKGSDIFYHITYDMEDIVCNGFECNKIIGNLLQNAIDAMHSTEDLAFGIRASIFKRRGCTVICVENRFTGDPNTIARVFEPGWSTKRGHEGIGLAMVLRTVEQYGGRVYPEFEEDLIRFVVTIPNRVRFE